MKTIGVIGGFGPQATVDFETRFHAFAPHVIPPSLNTGYPGLLVYYCRKSPIDLSVEDVLDAAHILGPHVDFLVMTANKPHLFCEQIEHAAGKPLVSMIDVTVAEVQRRHIRHVGVLEFMQGRIYQPPFEQMGMHVTYLPSALQLPLDQAIRQSHQWTTQPTTRIAVDDALHYLRSQGVEAVVLGCTDIPCLIGTDADAQDCINPTQLLVEAAIHRAIAD